MSGSEGTSGSKTATPKVTSADSGTEASGKGPLASGGVDQPLPATDTSKEDAYQERLDKEAEARLLPDEAKEQQMTPEEYDAIGKGEDYEPHNTDNTFGVPGKGVDAKSEEG